VQEVHEIKVPHSPQGFVRRSLEPAKGSCLDQGNKKERFVALFYLLENQPIDHPPLRGRLGLVLQKTGIAFFVLPDPESLE
jgi:hypothetical protein